MPTQNHTNYQNLAITVVDLYLLFFSEINSPSLAQHAFIKSIQEEKIVRYKSVY